MAERLCREKKKKIMGSISGYLKTRKERTGKEKL